MAENDFSNALDALGKAWEDTPAQSEDIFPDGTYQFRVDSAELTSVLDKKSNSKIPAVVLKFVCLSNPHNGRLLTSWDRLNPAQPNSIRFFKEKLKRLGLNCNVPPTELEIEIKKCLNHIVTAAIQNKKGTGSDQIFTNIYIRSDDGIDESVNSGS